MAQGLVRKRCFVQLFGYEPIGPDQRHHRFVREMARFQKTWNVESKVSPLQGADGFVVNWTIETRAPNWRVATEFHQFRWDDMIAADMTVSAWRRIPLGIAALLEFVFTGTVFRYFAVAWRYGLFSLYPLVALGGMIGVSILLPLAVMRAANFPYFALWGTGLGMGLGIAVFALLWRIVGPLLQLRHALDDWCFARDMAHRARPQLDERLDLFARELIRLARDTDADEIVIHGHSLGAPLALAVIVRALQFDPQFGRRGKPIHLVSTGSSLLKVALHPQAAWLRDVVKTVANDPAIFWMEFQALVDVLNTYKVDPVVALGLPRTGKPIIKIFYIRQMLEEATYRRFRLNFLRIHRQSVMGNERRYYYDYYMLCCGPIAIADRGEDPDRAVAAFAADGALIEHVSETTDDFAEVTEQSP
jgi:hypothetical protein